MAQPRRQGGAAAPLPPRLVVPSETSGLESDQALRRWLPEDQPDHAHRLPPEGFAHLPYDAIELATGGAVAVRQAARALLCRKQGLRAEILELDLRPVALATDLPAQLGSGPGPLRLGVQQQQDVEQSDRLDALLDEALDRCRNPVHVVSA